MKVFFNALEFLLENDVIQPEYITIGEEKIPEWVKNNALLWSENQIDDETFVNALEFLFENDIIKLKYYGTQWSTPKISVTTSSEIFDVWSYQNDVILEFENKVTKNIHLKLIEENKQLYKDIGVIGEEINAIVILPVFTSTAYSPNGFL